MNHILSRNKRRVLGLLAMRRRLFKEEEAVIPTEPDADHTYIFATNQNSANINNLFGETGSSESYKVVIPVDITIDSIAPPWVGSLISATWDATDSHFIIVIYGSLLGGAAGAFLSAATIAKVSSVDIYDVGIQFDGVVSLATSATPTVYTEFQ
jgi:hypothetical protein